MQIVVQLEEKYGKTKAQVIRDNMEQQLYYRSNDLSTAHYLELRCGNKSGFAKSTTERGGEVKSKGEAERPIPLLVFAHETRSHFAHEKGLFLTFGEYCLLDMK